MAAALDQAGVAPEPGQQAALAALSGGRPGAAVRLPQARAPALYRRLAGMLAAAPAADRAPLAALADEASGREARERLALMADLAPLLLSRVARMAAGAAPPEPSLGEDALAGRLARGPAGARAWAEAAAQARDAAARSLAVNLDPAATILDMWRAVDAAAPHGFAAPR
jgi:DNA polymerase-3 subunit delta'